MDRRAEQSAYALGANRSQVQVQLERHLQDQSDKLTPTQDNDEQQETKVGFNDIQSGVYCIDKTPGTDALVKLLFNRVWGVHT